MLTGNAEEEIQCSEVFNILKYQHCHEFIIWWKRCISILEWVEGMKDQFRLQQMK